MIKKIGLLLGSILLIVIIVEQVVLFQNILRKNQTCARQNIPLEQNGPVQCHIVGDISIASPNLFKQNVQLKKEGVIKESQSRFVYEFMVTNIAYKDTLPPQYKMKYDALLEYNTNSGMNGFLITKETSDKLKVYSAQNPDIEIAFSDIQVGDRVRYEVVFDGVVESFSGVQSIIITKL